MNGQSDHGQGQQNSTTPMPMPLPAQQPVQLPNNDPMVIGESHPIAQISPGALIIVQRFNVLVNKVNISSAALDGMFPPEWIPTIFTPIVDTPAYEFIRSLYNTVKSRFQDCKNKLRQYNDDIYQYPNDLVNTLNFMSYTFMECHCLYETGYASMTILARAIEHLVTGVMPAWPPAVYPPQ